MRDIRNTPSLLQSRRRAINNGLIAGATVIFLILIGIPGGTNDVEGLPGWFGWGLFMVITGIFAYSVSRPRNPAEERAQTLPGLLVNGLIVGMLAASLTVTMACALNAFQLWELAQPNGGVKLATELPNKITRVQDVFENVTPRTTAVLAGLPLEAIKPKDTTIPRAEPIWRFFLTACLLPIAGMIGVAANWGARMIRKRRQDRPKVVALDNGRAWAAIFLPLVFLAFIVLNGTLPASNAAYRDFIGGNAQLAGLLASFVLIASGLLAIRGAAGDPQQGTLVTRLALTLPVTLVLIGVALSAPGRSSNDLIFSPREANPVQREVDGKIQVVNDPAGQVENETLLNYRTLMLLGIGLIFVVGNILAARGRTTLRTLVALNLLLSAMIVTPLYLDKYQQSVLLLIGINILLGLGLNIVVGYAGLLDLGYVAFYAIGAYTYAFLSSNQDIRQGGVIMSLKFGGNDQTVQRVAAMLVIGAIITAITVGGGLYLSRRRSLNVRSAAPHDGLPGWLGPGLVALSVILTLLVINLLSGTALYESFAGFPAFIVGIVVGVLFAAFAGMALGVPVLRLRGDYLAIVTLGFGEIIRLFLNNVKEVTGGPAGLLNIPKLAVGNVEVGSNEGMLYVVMIGCLLVAALSLRLRSSRLGRAWGALKSDEDIAQAMGINLVNAKVLAFAIGAGFAGLGGVLFAARQANIFPDNFTLQVSINILALVIIGGMGSVPGVIVGALVLIGIPESLRVFESYRVLAFGALLVAMMLLRPGGLLPQPPQPMEGRARELERERAG